MPATAGRVRMPANNRVHSSAALQTHGIWQSAIGYDPYAPTADKETSRSAAASKSAPAVGSSDEAGGENAYASFQGLLALARVTRSDADDTRGACKRCGRVGHLTFQCRNFLSVKDDKEKDDLASIQTANAVFDKIKKGSGKGEEESEISEEEESESEDSDADSEMERIIAERFGKKRSGKEMEKKERRRGRSKKRSSRRAASTSSDESEEVDRKERKRRRRGDEDRKSRREKRRRRSHRKDGDSSEEDRRRRRRRHRRSGGRKESSGTGSESESSESDYRRKRRRQKSRKDRNESDESDRDVALAPNRKRSE